MTKVVKFGGSSLASAEQFKKVKDIITAEDSRRFVVPSAPGKRFSADTKVTDMLYGCYDLAAKGKDFTKEFDAIKERYNGIISELGLDMSLENEFNVIKACFIGKAGRDYAASRGEFLNGMVLANYLGYNFIDAADVIFFDERGQFDAKRTNKVLSERLEGLDNAVVPGFYGSMPNDTIKTFSRGGSDITGSIVAAAVNADLYENWTDTSGFLTTDPRIVKDPAPITTITYKELRELSYMGASVFHEDAIFPVRKAGIAINIKNTNAPEAPGTLIVESTSQKPAYTITGIAGKKGFTVINIEKDMMNAELGFGRRVLEVFEKNGVSFEHMPSGIDTMSVIVTQEEFADKEQEILAGLHRNCHPDMIEIETDLALIAVVGRAMKANRGTAGRIFSALAHSHVNVKMIDQGSSELNVIIGVSESDFETAVKSIYDIFVETKL
ncbi:MAG: aspartate kinase [Ruminococcus albus]|jgi:aspartate kinase|uniref:Aspartokinase n=1 Tax=Ruminococcus albus SY3 TaxID=1341156 RepID=A0A011WLK9_RUMAL|nr:aspartate kinase [Ruminococcus albus]EXM37925.1 aspartate kinase [Ruminococcus albus SY3]MBE6868028.1 aspartate kinase [Ruminococcus albus]